MISIRGASEHNLKSVDLDIPRRVLTVVTGVSGSGKSSLAFDTICAEGRRRYLETFSSYARQFLGHLSRPSVAHIDGLSPAVALDQQVHIASPRSTVGTMTTLYDLLRLLWARTGTIVATPDAPRLERALFSFNSPRGACPQCRGLGVEDRLDADLLVAEPSKSVRAGALRITTPSGYVIYSQVTLDVLDEVCHAHGFSLDVPWQDLSAEQRDIILNGSDRIRIPYGKHPLSSRLRWKGITAKPREEGVYKGILPVMEQILRTKRNRNILRFVRSMPCRACGGTRLRPEALRVTVAGLSIAQAAALSIDDLRRFLAPGNETGLRNGVRPHYKNGIEAAIASQVIARCDMLQALGLGYLTLDRPAPTVSRGEAHRLRLAQLASLGLGGVLYVLDEPSVGLHHRDTRRLLDVLRAVRDRGNTVLVVDHDEQTVRSADWIVDVGPAAGSGGGEVLYCGPAADFLASGRGGESAGLQASRTHAFLTGGERIEPPATRRGGTGRLVVSGVTKHNLHDVTVEFALGALNLVTGVSGAGKSTLLEATVHALSGGTVRAPASFDQAGATVKIVRAGPAPLQTAPDPRAPTGSRSRTRASGALVPARRTDARAFDKIIAIDQAPIGRTPRSNPATYTGLFDFVRDLFAAQPDAVRRDFGKGRFSFNVKGGRCETCEGAGVRQIGMHFLGTVSVVCETCAGRRFNDETLEVCYRGLNIHDVLDMPIAQAAGFFADTAPIARTVEAMRALGLGYLTLGHPATMLSGGEAQRVKLAAELARPGTGRTLYLLDEPTTGLHPADVAQLLAAIDRLIEKGNTVITVEHDLDVVRVADWVVDLGPGSGAEGGRVVAMGTPEAIATCAASATGDALRETASRRAEALRHDHRDDALRDAQDAPRDGDDALPRDRPSAAAQAFSPGRRRRPPIRLANVTTHNLQHVDVEIPANRITVITGVSGSGKSSLAFDTLFAEGQQRFADSFSTYARRFVDHSSEAEFDAASGLTPTIAISQRAPSRNPRSTVGTMTEILDDCRLLYARTGTRFCPACDAALEGGRCPRCGFTGVRTLMASMFSPNSEHGACPSCKGLGFVLDCDPSTLLTDPSRPLNAGAMSGHKTGRFYGDPHGQHMAILFAAGRALHIDFSTPWSGLDEDARAIALRGAGDRVFDVEWRYVRGRRTGVHRFQSRWAGLLACVRDEYERKHADARGEAMEGLMAPVTCDACGGGKLKPEFLAVRVAGIGIHQLLAQSADDCLAFFEALATDATLDSQGTAVVAALRSEVTGRLQRLRDAGLAYLTLDRPANTLSGGEAQRVRLATQLGSGLTGITYVLDEPTIGLHPRDTASLVALLGDLRDAGNTVVVVEHDRDVLAAADHVIEIGPGAGVHGGRIVACGTPAEVRRNPASRTARLLAREFPAPSADPRRPLVRGIGIRDARVHNLRGLDVDIPAGGLACLTGVSGSGKSTLVFDVLAPSVAALLAHRRRERAHDPADGGPHGKQKPAGAGSLVNRVDARSGAVHCRELALHVPFRSLVRVEHASVGASPWSNPATHTGLFDAVRDLFARTEAARTRGFGRQHFSTLAKGGRCDACEGLGQIRVSMDFLPDVWMTCEACQGTRYIADVLACRIEGRSIADVLEMSVDEAREFFDVGRITGPLDILREVGLGYVRLGQPARTLSGGERQRLVLATGLMQPGGGPTLYLFDEPTTGLHADDVAQLLRVFDRLIAAGHTLIVIEHNLDVIAASDWIVDLGPEGGDRGGRIVAEGPPETVAAHPESHTGRALERGWPRVEPSGPD